MAYGLASTCTRRRTNADVGGVVRRAVDLLVSLLLLVIPYFDMANRFGLKDTYLGLILPSLGDIDRLADKLPQHGPQLGLDSEADAVVHALGEGNTWTIALGPGTQPGRILLWNGRHGVLG